MNDYYKVRSHTLLRYKIIYFFVASIIQIVWIMVANWWKLGLLVVMHKAHNVHFYRRLLNEFNIK